MYIGTWAGAPSISFCESATYVKSLSSILDVGGLLINIVLVDISIDIWIPNLLVALVHASRPMVAISSLPLNVSFQPSKRICHEAPDNLPDPLDPSVRTLYPDDDTLLMLFVNSSGTTASGLFLRSWLDLKRDKPEKTIFLLWSLPNFTSATVVIMNTFAPNRR